MQSKDISDRKMLPAVMAKSIMDLLSTLFSMNRDLYAATAAFTTLLLQFEKFYKIELCKHYVLGRPGTGKIHFEE